MQMDWNKLISCERYQKPLAKEEQQRSQFQRDFDRIIFSSAFRRLQDKTQVHPFPDSDYIRRRLTHSLEVSCVGRSLGTDLGNYLEKQNICQNISREVSLPSTLSQIVSNACIAHDIGNPPFGHAGEKAIGAWFKANLSGYKFNLTSQQRIDLEYFEGNAQGFRLLTRLLENRNSGGLQLTYATLAAFTKYPAPARERPSKEKTSSEPPVPIEEKKHGYFEEDRGEFQKIAETVGLTKTQIGWKRHPLAFLMEAADDICYRIIDVEDAFKLHRIPFEKAKELLEAIISTKADSKGYDEDETIGWLRAKAIGVLIAQTSATIRKNYYNLMNGQISNSLIDEIDSAHAVNEAHEEVKNKVFNWERTVSAEIAGTQMIVDILDRLVSAIANPNSHKNSLLCKIIPHYQESVNDDYQKLLLVTDFISGMTDSYLQKIHRRITGQSIY